MQTRRAKGRYDPNLQEQVSGLSGEYGFFLVAKEMPGEVPRVVFPMDCI
jgi:hypothetical protein